MERKLRQTWYSGRSSVNPMLPPTVKTLIIINVAVFLLELMTRFRLTTWFGMTPALFWHGMLWQPVTYMFLHGSWTHLLINMFVLWMFGRSLEIFWGPKRFLNYYFITGIGAGLLQAVIQPGSSIPTVGASGAVYGLLLAFGMTFPNQLIFIYFLFPIRAKYFVIIMGAVELFAGLSQPGSPIAHFAHLGGMLFGLVYLKWGDWRLRMRRWQGERVSRRHLDVVNQKRREKEDLQREVDDLLDKINISGLDSLTAREKARLREASRKLREWEEEL
ncbi:MAG TPA: rhomboid family intramembrane serine protease [Bacteroidetes bacterium]|nr:rhomboid family intramembrane serine protease [Bacteroidota bacterium]